MSEFDEDRCITMDEYAKDYKDWQQQMDALAAQVAALREAIEACQVAFAAEFDARRPQGIAVREALRMSREALAQSPADALDALKRAHVESLKGSSGDVALVRMTRSVVEDFGARTADGSAALSYRITDNKDGTSDMVVTRAEDGWLDALKRETVDQIRERCEAECVNGLVPEVAALRAQVAALREALGRAVKAAENWQEFTDSPGLADERADDAAVIAAAEEMSCAVCRESAALALTPAAALDARDLKIAEWVREECARWLDSVAKKNDRDHHLCACSECYMMKMARAWASRIRALDLPALLAEARHE